jgi:hypothetical protein
VEERLLIDDRADGCWVTFAADAAGRRVLIGRGAFSKVGMLARLPASCHGCAAPLQACRVSDGSAAAPHHAYANASAGSLSQSHFCSPLDSSASTP